MEGDGLGWKIQLAPVLLVPSVFQIHNIFDSSVCLHLSMHVRIHELN